MSIEARRWAQLQAGELKQPEKYVLETLADFAQEDHLAWPSRRKLVERTLLSVDSVDRHLGRLVELGYITKEKRFIGDTKVHTSSIYRLNLDFGIQREAKRSSKGSRSLRPPPRVVAPEFDFDEPVAARSGDGSRSLPPTVAAKPAATIEPVSEQEREPPLPPEGAGECEPSEGSRKGEPQRREFDRLLEAFGATPIQFRQSAFEAFQRLARHDQLNAIAHAAEYRRRSEADKRKPVFVATYIAERMWEGFAGNGGKPRSRNMVFIVKGSNDWKVLAAEGIELKGFSMHKGEAGDWVPRR
jgi:DNA-binding transcriptional ArsR family regulator